MTTRDTISAQIWLPYYKQGDDLQNVKTDDAKTTLLNHIDLLTVAICKLKDIHDLLPDDSGVDLSGDCHYINIKGQKSLIEKLVSQGLARMEDTSENSADEVDTDD